MTKLYKVALCEVVSLDKDIVDKKVGLIKTAAGRVMIEPNSDKAKIIEAEITKHPTALFFRAKAIKANEANSNGDYFSEEELLKSYKSFEGVPFFTNHDNQNIENARGKIIYAEWNPEEKAVYTISFVDREAYPHICRSIEQEYVTGVSMGASVEYSICNICGNSATKTEEYCTHIKEKKGRRFSGKVRNVTTGQTKEFKNELVFEYNYGIKFIELSAVVDPACPSCHIEGIIPNDNFLKKVANVENSLHMIKTSAMEKKASQEEIAQLNEALTTLETIAVNLVKNRKQVEVEFASDLVSILSELQTFVDELTGAGYANLQTNVPGNAETPPAAMPSEEVPAQPMPQGAGMEAMPVSAEGAMGAQPSAPAGNVSGMPGNSPVKMPSLPITAPAKPRAFDTTRLHKIAERLSDLGNKMYNTEGEDMSKRRTISEKIGQKKIATEYLSNSWKEKQTFFEYINKVPSLQDSENKLSVKKSDDSFIIVAESRKDPKIARTWSYEDLSEEDKRLIKESPKTAALNLLNRFAKNINQKEGVKMSNVKEAGAQSVNKEPDVITEVQLEEKGLYHSRTNTEEDVITQKQLDAKRSGVEQEVITEAQLQAKTNKMHPRTEDTPDVITQAQLNTNKGASPRDNASIDEVTQAQLKGNRTGTEADVITEKQLDSVDSPWERAADANTSLFKSAADHMKSVVDVLADTAICTGCTPKEACEVAGSMVASTKGRVELQKAILNPSAKSSVDYSTRLAYWGGKNIKVAGVGADEISATIVNGLKLVVADSSINADVIIDAIDVVAEGQNGISVISERIDQKLSEASKVTVKANRKDELRAALSSGTKQSREQEREALLASVNSDQKLTREAERALWTKFASKKDGKTADTMIETSYSEMGVAKASIKDEKTLRSVIKTFAKGALAAKNIRLAAITNVTIDGETISIAVQTGEGEDSVEIPISGEQTSVDDNEIMPEGDMSGEGLESSLPPPPAMPEGMGSAPAPAQSLTPAPGPVASSKNIKKQAQVGGGVPATPGGVSGGPGAPESALPAPTPTGDQELGALTTDDAALGEVADEIPTAGEQQMPYSICPECGSSDVDVTQQEDGGIHGDCKACGSEYEALVKKEIEFKIIKPTQSDGKEGAEVPEAPEVPALPVAAQTKITKDSLIRIASNRKKHGHVCPACGMTQCKTASESNGHSAYTCPACKTGVEKDVLINVNNPDQSYLRVKWDLVPNSNCPDCKTAAKKFASRIRVEKMIKQAADTTFPMANCMELVARKWGGNTVASFGPCKGEALADCVCGQLKKLGLRKVRHLEKLATAMSQKDPMDKCVEDYMKKSFEKKEAQNICGCMKKKYASKVDDNIFIQAFMDDIDSGAEKDFNADDAEVMGDMLGEDHAMDVSELEADIPEGEMDIGDAIGGDETVTIEISKATADELAGAATEAVASSVTEESPELPKEEEIDVEIEDTKDVASPSLDVGGEIKPEEEMSMALSMQTHKLMRVGETVVKVAATPKLVENIEGNVEAKVPRAKATMGKEGPDNIDVKMNKPSIPRGKATMGKEGPDNIDKPAGLPDVAVDSSYMGHEKEIQQGMPGINNEIKGTVIADNKKVTKEAKQLTEVDSIEGNVDAKIPRAKATMGKEGPDNIDVKMDKPSVPRSKATMGKEGPDNIDVKMDGPDVPVDSAYMGHENEVQQGMPGINSEILKNVQQKRDVQMERIANARKVKAIEVAAKFLATKRINEDAYENVVEALSRFEIDKIASVADNMYPKKQVTSSASQEDKEVHSGAAIVLESKEANAGESLMQKLSSSFTIGNRSFDEKLTIYGEK